MSIGQYTPVFGGDVTAFGEVLVVFGGQSSEREVSLNSGQAVLNALLKKGVNAKGLDIQQNPVSEITQQSFDRVFIVLHGEGGEDGKIQALLDLLSVPYTGSRHAASALAMDKLKTKQVWQAIGLPTPQFLLLSETTNWPVALEELGGDAFVKPIHEGSSIGMSMIASADELSTAFEKANRFDSEVIAERRIKGAEFTVAILNGVTLAPIRLDAHQPFYDYEAKYISNATEYLCPCGLSVEKEQEIKMLALNAFNVVGCSGWGRVDVMQNEAGEFFLLEVNTVPGMTDHSLVPMAAMHVGLSFEQLVLEILASTLI